MVVVLKYSLVGTPLVILTILFLYLAAIYGSEGKRRINWYLVLFYSLIAGDVVWIVVSCANLNPIQFIATMTVVAVLIVLVALLWLSFMIKSFRLPGP